MDASIARVGLQASVEGSGGHTASLVLKDDGAAPDVLADDGVYSGLMTYNQNGVYTVTVNFDNQRGGAYLTAISANHAIGPNGEAWTPITTSVTETFTVTASTQITITNYQVDDHGDTPQAATVVQPDDDDVAGRIDRAGDVDVFRMTPTVTSTLVLRVSDLAAGMLPRIRVLAADGLTVLLDVDVQPQGDEYFFTRLDVQAGDPFYVEVSHQDSNASSGFYAISAGESLPNAWEQPPHLLFLPILLR